MEGCAADLAHCDDPSLHNPGHAHRHPLCLLLRLQADGGSKSHGSCRFDAFNNDLKDLF